MNFKTTLFLLVLVVAVGIAIFFTNSREDKNKSPKSEQRKLVDLDAADVTRVAITGSDDKRLVLQKTGADWNMVEPSAARAKTFEVDDLVRALVGLQSRQQLDASKKTSGGLDHPSFVVELTSKTKGNTKLSFGDNSTVGDSLYVLVNDGSKPDVVGNAIFATLSKPASTYRDMKLVNTPASDVRQLSITSKGSTIRLEKNGENWQVTEPVKIPAETSAVTDILTGISGLEATEFVDDPSAAAKATLAHPRLTVAFSTAAPSTQPAGTQPAAEAAGVETIRFGGYQDILKSNVFASLNGKEVALVPATTLKTFEKTTLDLRNRDVVNLPPDRVSSFTVSVNRPATTQPTTRPAETHEFSIERHKVAAAVLGPALPGGVTPPASNPASPTTRPAVATTQPAATSEAAVASTQPAATAPSAAATEPSAPATQPAIASTQPATQPDEVASAKWVFTSGKTGAAEEGQVKELLDSLHPLRAEKYVEPAKVSGATYTLTVHLIAATAADQPEDVALTFIDTGTAINGFYKDLQFTVDRSLIEKLDGDFKTKKAPPAAPPAFNGGGGSPFGG